MFNNLKNLFDNTVMNNFSRIDSGHPSNIYIGRDCNYRPTLFVVSVHRPIDIVSSSLIDVYIGIRDDGNWGISWSLNDNDSIDMFCYFCNDIIESSRAIMDNKRGINFICERYKQWQIMLKKNTQGLLDKKQIKGIVGEILFMENYLIPLYGESLSVNSWLGPEKLPKDFICNDSWYEIKSISSNIDIIHISSLEQLDADTTGSLIVINLDSTSYSDIEKVSVNTYVQDFLNTLDDNNKSIITQKLLKQGYYPRPEYDQFNFKFKGYKKYKVDSTFPCLRKKCLPNSVVSAKYDLTLSAINQFLLEENTIWR